MKNAPLIKTITDRKAKAVKAGRVPCISYGRVSTEQQAEGKALEFKAVLAKRYTQAHNLDLVHEVEVAESAKDEGRKEFAQILELSESCGVLDVLFTDATRISRNAGDSARIIKLVKTGKVRVHIVLTNTVYDKDTDPGQLRRLQYDLVDAEHEIGVLSLRQRTRNKLNKEFGVAHHSPRFGYVKDKVANKWVFDPKTKKQVMFLFDQWDSRRHPSLLAFAEFLNRQGILSERTTTRGKKSKHKWHVGSLHAFLTNPFFHGEFYSRVDDKFYKGTHDRYYERKRFELRMTRLDDGYVGRRKHIRDYAFAQLLHCSCGRTFSGETKTHRATPQTLYAHRCADKPRTNGALTVVTINERDMWPLIDAKIEADRFSPQFAANLMTLFDDVARATFTKQKETRAHFNRKEAELDAQKERLLSLYARGLIDDAVALNAQINKITEQIEDVRKEENRVMRMDVDKVLSKTGTFIDMARDLPKVYLKADVKDKAGFLKRMVRRIEINDQREIRLTYRDGLSSLMRGSILELKRQSTTLTKQKSAVRETDNLCAQPDEFRTLQETVYKLAAWLSKAA